MCVYRIRNVAIDVSLIMCGVHECTLICTKIAAYITDLLIKHSVNS